MSENKRGRPYSAEVAQRMIAEGIRRLHILADREDKKDVVLSAIQTVTPPTEEEIEAIKCFVTASEQNKDNFNVLFPGKPSKAILDALKASGYKWGRRVKRWYGPKDKLPEFLKDFVEE